MSSCPKPHLKQVLLGQIAQGLDFRNLTGQKLYSLFGYLFPRLTIPGVGKCFLVASCCCCSLLISADFASSLPVRKQSWRRPQNPGIFLWFHRNVVSHRCSKLAWGGVEGGWGGGGVWNAQSGSQRFYLGNVSQPVILAQAQRAWLLDLVEPQNFGGRLADKLMLL